MNKFSKVSYKQYYKDYSETCNTPIESEFFKWMYDEIKIPQRATKGSCGYDFYAPMGFTLAPGQSFKFPTGIRVELDEGRFLMCVPRSGLGFKYRLQLDNSVGIVDMDYAFAENEGHIFVKLTNDSKENKTVTIEKGQAFMQGIILKYDITEDDCADGIRTGGLGSTSKTSEA